MVRFAIGINGKEQALAPGDKRKRKQNMPLLITIAALFAVQIYAPAFAGAWPRASGSGYADQISLGWISEIYEDREQSYASQSSYVAVSFSPPDHRFNMLVLRGENAVVGRLETFRSYRLEVGWSFP